MHGFAPSRRLTRRPPSPWPLPPCPLPPTALLSPLAICPQAPCNNMATTTASPAGAFLSCPRPAPSSWPLPSMPHALPLGTRQQVLQLLSRDLLGASSGGAEHLTARCATSPVGTACPLLQGAPPCPSRANPPRRGPPSGRLTASRGATRRRLSCSLTGNRLEQNTTQRSLHRGPLDAWTGAVGCACQGMGYSGVPQPCRSTGRSSLSRRPAPAASRPRLRSHSPLGPAKTPLGGAMAVAHPSLHVPHSKTSRRYHRHRLGV